MAQMFQDNKIENTLQDAKSRTTSEIKNYIYDLIALVIVAAIVMASLNALGFIDLSSEDVRQQLLDFFIEWLPYFMAAVLLNSDLYQKGVFIGKRTKKYIDTAMAYSNIVNNLTGEQIDGLDDFCISYNDKALKDIQTQILKKEGLSYERFISETTVKVNDKEIVRKALINCTKEELFEQDLNKAQVKVVLKAKNVNIKGLTSNLLLSSINVKDRTDIGPDEQTLATRSNIVSAIRFFVSTFCMSLIVVKDISTWGWASLIIVIFKVAYIVAKSYMSYFKGYNNITVDIVSHIGRKTDILKMYIRYEPEKVVENNDNIVTENQI